MNNGFQSEVLIQINLFCKGRIFKSISSRGGESSKNVIYKETFFFRGKDGNDLSYNFCKGKFPKSTVLCQNLN